MKEENLYINMGWVSFICFVYVTGLRLSEACNVTFADIDRNRLQIRVRNGKGSKDRYIEIPATLIDILATYYQRMKPEKYLFNGYSKGERYCSSSGQWMNEWFLAW